jgi:hypothetical protein
VIIDAPALGFAGMGFGLCHPWRNIAVLVPTPDHSLVLPQKFADNFAFWGIRLPMPVLAARQPGHKYSEGWFI